MPTPHRPDQSSGGSGPPARSSRPAKVLLVEDDPLLRTVLSQVVQTLGYHVDEVASGPEAIALFSEARHDLLVTDLSMSGMSGWEVTHRVRTIEPRVAIIILTGYATDADHERAQAERITLLQKPVPMERLLEIVAAIMTDRTRS